MTTISPYELSQCLKAIGGIAERLPAALTLELDETANGAIADATGKISRALETCKQFEATFRAKEDELCKFIDDTFARVKQARDAMRKRMEELPSVTMQFKSHEINDIERLVKVASELSFLSDDAWKRLIDLAKAMSKQ